MDVFLNKYRKHIASAFGVDCNIFDVMLKEFNNDNENYCNRCPFQCDFKNTHLYGCYESVRWDNKYIYYCPCGYIFIAVPIFDKQNVLTSGVVSGPILMGDKEDFEGDYEDSLPNFSTARVNDISEIISKIFSSERPQGYTVPSTEDFLNNVYKELEALSVDGYYPIDLEKELQKSITMCDGANARKILNKLLGQIFFHSNGDFKIIKARVFELIVLLSRSAIEGGADLRHIFSLNNSYLSELDGFKTLEDMSVWLNGIINSFVSYVFEFKDVKHADTIYKITAYIKANYMLKLSLDDIADHVYLSKTYVSKIFKEEMNIPLSRYINRIRIEKSKTLLVDNSLTIVDVANLSGFEDQSYFTKTFKKLTGISPGKYKELHSKL